MSTVAQNHQIFNYESPTTLLAHLDLLESEADYHWTQFEQLTLSAQDHLDHYDAAVADRRELSRQVSRVLAEAERVLA